MKNPLSFKQQVKNWNTHYQVGQAVLLRKDDGKTILTKTRSQAQILSGHSAVIWLDGIVGCYLLDRVSAVVTSPTSECSE